jgi:U3 small nucleolar RNA-associated protein 23
VITQCSIRHLYAAKNEDGIKKAIDLAQTLERRRCGHHPDNYPEPLSAEECIKSVVDPRDNGNNKHCYVVASQSLDLRRLMRQVKGVPLVYVKRAVMVMEPMADQTEDFRQAEEKRKFRSGLKNKAGEKRKRDDEVEEGDKADGVDKGDRSEPEPKPKKKKRGPKEPNPLAVKKRKSKTNEEELPNKAELTAAIATDPVEGPAKKKRKRQRKKPGTSDPSQTTKPVAESEADPAPDSLAA